MEGKSEREYLRLWARAGLYFVLPLMLFGCRKLPPQPPSPPEPQVHFPVQEPKNSIVEREKVAGTWNYHDGNIVYCLTLNEEGIGTYNWQEGRFVTTNITDNKWEGIWYQTKNDREGKFNLQLSADGNYAEGQWWYTRIGNNRAPTQEGDRFTLRRVPCTPSTEVDTVLLPLEK